MKDLVLLAGWGFDQRVWRPVADPLAAHFRLHFDTDVPPPGAVVCGWSLGALRALRWAERYPDRVARIVLVGATPRFVRTSDWPAAQPAELLDSFAAAVAADPAGALRRFAALLNQGDDQARALTRQMQALVAAHWPDAATLADGLEQLRDIDLREVSRPPPPADAGGARRARSADAAGGGALAGGAVAEWPPGGRRRGRPCALPCPAGTVRHLAGGVCR